MKNRIAIALLIALLLSLALAGTAFGISVCSLVNFSTTTGMPGAVVDVYGEAINGAGISFTWDGASLGSTTAGSGGNYSFVFNVPADAAVGNHTVMVTIDYEGIEECPTTFVVEADAIAPADVTPTDTAALPVTLPSTGIMMLPAGALIAAGAGLLAVRRRQG